MRGINSRDGCHSPGVPGPGEELSFTSLGILPTWDSLKLRCVTRSVKVKQVLARTLVIQQHESRFRTNDHRREPVARSNPAQSEHVVAGREG